MYATLANMRERFSDQELIQLTDQALVGAIDSASVDAAIGDASAEIDSYLAGTYYPPLATVPPMLTRRCCDIARYLLHKDGVAEPVRKGYDDAIAWLKDVARGIVKLDVAGAEPASAPATIETMDSIVADRRKCMGGF